MEVERGKGISGGGEGEGDEWRWRGEGDERNRRRSQGGREGRMGAGWACGMFSYLCMLFITKEQPLTYISVLFLLFSTNHLAQLMENVCLNSNTTIT